MKTTDFLAGRNVERQAVTRYINRHPEIFEGHIKKLGKEMELDDAALAALDAKYPLPAPITVITGLPYEEVIRLQNELISSQRRIEELQSRLLTAQEQLSTAKVTELRLEDRQKRISELEAAAESQKTEMEELRAELEAERSKTWLQKLFTSY